MEYQVLSLKWRPKLFDDVIGQTHITRSLQNVILQKKIGHAYLFTGTRGIGKTSIARIFAKALRCSSLQEDGNPCLVCNSCISMDQSSALDFIEIDGASNNGVEHVRQLIDNVQYLPASGKYKVYVIDEVHMLSTSAFNALLKTIEEPPAHVVFIFATTDPEKLLGTVLSRCQRFDFRNADVDTLLEQLKKIAKHDGITYESEFLLRQIASQGKGSVRDTLSLLDQVLSYSENNHITEDGLISSLGLARVSAIKSIVSAIFNSDAKVCSNVFRVLVQENVAVKNIALSVLDSLYEIIKDVDSPQKLVDRGFIESGDLADISSAELFWIYEVLAKDLGFSVGSIDPEKVTEVVLQKVCMRRNFLAKDFKPIVTNDVVEVVSDKVEPEVIVEQAVEQAVAEVIEEKDHWTEFLEYMQKRYPASASNLEQGNILEDIQIGGEILEVKLGFTKASGVFLDYLKEPDVYDRLVEKLADFFQYSKEKVSLALTSVDDVFKNEKNFRSKAEQAYIEQKESESQTKSRIENNTFVKQAANLFKAKVDKVIISNND